MIRRIGAIAILALSLTSCTVGPDYRAPEQNVSSGFSEDLEAAPASPRSRITSGRADVARWWTAFHDAELESLVGRALAGNLDLEIAASRVREARAARAVAAGGQYPALNASGSVTHLHISKAGPLGILPKRDFNLFQAGFDASWEADLFGGIRRRVEAADADVQASVEAARDVQVTVVSEVARIYIEFRALQRRRQISVENLAAQREVLALTKDRFSNGLVTRLDVLRQSALVAIGEAELPSLEAGAVAAQHALAWLLGEEPRALANELAVDGAIPAVPAEVPIGVSADLLRRRPDLRQAERDLAAATARIGVATADLYPRLSITGTIGFLATKGSNLSQPGDMLYDGVRPTLSWPVFAGGSILANIDVRTQVAEQYLMGYRQKVLLALKEVEDALVRYRTAQDRRDALAQAVKEDQSSLDLARDQYKEGMVDFLAVLDAQRALLSAQDSLVQEEQAISVGLVSLFKALGGGWEETSPEPD